MNLFKKIGRALAKVAKPAAAVALGLATGGAAVPLILGAGAAALNKPKASPAAALPQAPQAPVIEPVQLGVLDRLKAAAGSVLRAGVNAGRVEAASQVQVLGTGGAAAAANRIDPARDAVSIPTTEKTLIIIGIGLVLAVMLLRGGHN